MVLNLGTLTATMRYIRRGELSNADKRAKAAAIANGYEILGAYASKELRAKSLDYYRSGQKLYDHLVPI
mgnify:CR=1 FL=1